MITKEKQREYAQIYRDKNRDRMNAYFKEYRKTHPKTAEQKEAVKKYNCKYFLVNRETFYKKAKQWQKDNPKRYKELCQRYRDKNGNEINERSRQRRIKRNPLTNKAIKGTMSVIEKFLLDKKYDTEEQFFLFKTLMILKGKLIYLNKNK